MTRRALVLRALGVGDFLAGVPALRALRRALPDHEISLAAPAVLAPLVELSRTVDRLVDTGELQPVPWTGPPPEVAVDLHGNGSASKALLEALAPAQLVAFGGRTSDGGSHDGPPWRVDEHERDRWCRLVGSAFDCTADPDDLLLLPPTASSPVPGAVVVHPGAASAARRWPEERFAEVAAWASSAGAPVVVTGGRDEVALAGRVCRRAALPVASCRAGRTGLGEVAALVASARLVICGDTGVAHLASAYRTPSVVLFGPTPPQRWGPPARPEHDAVWRGTRPGNPHAPVVDPALLRITVADVVRRAALLSGLTTPWSSVP